MEQKREASLTKAEVKQDRKLIRFFLAGFLVVFLLSCIAIFVIENQMAAFARNEIQTNESRVVRLENELLSKEIGGILGDLHYIHHIYETALADPKGHSEIVTHWTEFSLHRGIYDQIRYIDSLGDERIRINFDGEKAYAVEPQALQNKANRYYFRETAKLPSGVVYVSPLDLNVENDEVEQPIKPMIRFSVPLYQADHSFSGILILNYLAQDVLADFKELAKTSNGYVALLNYDGYWFSCGNQDNEWNFMYDDRKNQTFGALYPEEWAMIRKGPGQVVTENGLFTFQPVSLENIFSHEGSRMEETRIAAADRMWFIVSAVPPDSESAYYFSQDPLIIWKNIIKKNGYQLIWLAFISGVVGFVIFLNRRQYYRVKYFSEHDPLTGLLNRRAGYEALQRMLQESDKSKEPVSLCFVDINGLKQVNDLLGHDLGDELILTVSRIMGQTIRKEDLAVRLGGDEFLIVFRGIDPARAELIWGRIVEKFEMINQEENRKYLVSVSHGIVARENQHTSEMDELIRLADEKMYQEKSEIKKALSVIRERNGDSWKQ
ncbi:MAG: GGDEF domain-containing protein [Eubacteriales bacterium]|nr:GGDEF domain-containing protein [Eubacteriales bacterium]